MKILFITSKDFGELSLAAFFARNQSFKSVFAVPHDRLAYFDDVYDVIYSYSSVVELKRLILKESPDIISMHTAYLIMNGGLASQQDFEDLFHFIKQLGCKVMTSDPFVRVYDYYPDCSFSLHGVELTDLKKEMTYLNDYLRELPHLYGFPSSNKFKNAYSFFNNKFCVDTKKRWQNPENTNYWLLILGELDSTLLLARYGDVFIIELLNRLKEIASHHKNRVRAVLPKEIAKVLREALVNFPTIQIYDFLTLTEFEKLIYESQIVCYWNVFSNSILFCYYYDIPFLCFDKGHIANLSPDLFQHMSEGIYCKGKPEFIDFFKPIEPDLALLLQEHYSLANRKVILEEYHQLPSPDEVLATIIHDDSKY